MLTCGHFLNLLPNILPKGAKRLGLSQYQQLAQLQLKPLRLALQRQCLNLCQLLYLVKSLCLPLHLWQLLCLLRWPLLLLLAGRNVGGSNVP
ncbi:hypothetical protein SAMN02982919_03250 [Giesbergeria anulus]|uniref:Uncharacterized protein n=1 Tax=Giesbergeria anulus TaxID=180197 RepID=A0A1H9SY50_9BURK|nr:hypothetical protein SAMN02982919_03250 [Giesbergeria anulus]